MATSLLFRTSDQARAQETIKLHLGSEETKPELATKSNRRRKPNKYAQQKKQAQRGLGVAQLERLRLKELKPLNHSCQFQLPMVQTTLPISEPLGGVPVQYGAVTYSGGPVVINSTGGALFGIDGSGLMLQSSGNGGFGCDVRGLKKDDLVMVDPIFYGIGICDERLIAAAYGTSKELSSIPNTIPCLSSGRCDTSCKGVEVVSVHRKGNTGGAGRGRVVMEYDFFPVASKNGRRTYTEDTEMPPFEASYSNDNITAANGTCSNNFIDLSLKL